MKKIMIALALAGFIYSGAEAQTTKTQTKSGQECKVVKKKVTGKKYVRTNKPATATVLASQYQVCREEGGYYVCCIYNNSSTARSLR
ncbi:MAG: hypothetical protein K0Q79_3654 [Flavipsychrobacter sp.]|jgi:hypothetical protein|nr:hypothetical protein [Flavipsychrobacter sp.]